ncbi:hypothetical protein pb186bvf_020235 [Paramecium bursaria]
MRIIYKTLNLLQLLVYDQLFFRWIQHNIFNNSQGIFQQKGYNNRLDKLSININYFIASQVLSNKLMTLLSLTFILVYPYTLLEYQIQQYDMQLRKSSNFRDDQKDIKGDDLISQLTMLFKKLMKNLEDTKKNKDRHIQKIKKKEMAHQQGKKQKNQDSKNMRFHRVHKNQIITKLTLFIDQLHLQISQVQSILKSINFGDTVMINRNEIIVDAKSQYIQSDQLKEYNIKQKKNIKKGITQYLVLIPYLTKQIN